MAKSLVRQSPPIDKDAALQQLQEQFNALQTTLHAVIASELDDGAPKVGKASTAARPTTIKERRAQALAKLTGGREISPALRRLLADVGEPKRQQKPRTMPSRAVYVCKPATSGAMIKALQDLTPAAKTIFFYLVDHPRSAVPDISASLDLKPKTVANLLSVMKTLDLVNSEKR